MARPAARHRKESRPASPGGRPVWSGSLRLALVTVAVQLYSAVKPGARIAFHQIDPKSGKRVRYEKVAPGAGPVDADKIVKGYEVSKGNYVLVTDEELEAVKIEARKTFDLVQFVDHCEIDPIYFEKPYYVLPDGEMAEEAYAVLRDALRSTGKMGIGQFVMRGREYVAALKPCGDGMMLETLRFADEVRAAAPFFADIEDENADPELLDLAKELIGRKTGKFDPDRFQDHYTEALRDLIDEKARTGKPLSVDDAEPASSGGAKVIDLVAALKRSLAQKAEAGGGAAANDEAAAPSTAAATKTTKAPAKPAAKAAAKAKPAAKAPPRRKAG